MTKMRRKSRRELINNNKNNSTNFSGLDTCPSKNLSVDNINLSFAGCGFNGIYYVGVASCFLEYCPKVSFNKISGVSAGSLVATALACQMPLAQSTSEVLKVAIQARSRALGPFHPTFDVNKIITDALDKCLPDDAHKRVNGRLHISVTRVSDNKNVILSQFESKDDLIQAVLCSCFIPFWSGIIPPKFHGVSYIDGGLSNNLIVLDENTVTVTPFAGESDICPMDIYHPTYQINILNTSFAMTPHNIYRLYGLLFPPPPETMSKMCHQGFEDALRFLQRSNKISCLRCVSIQSSFTVDKTDKILKTTSGVSVEDIDVDDEINGPDDESNLMVKRRNMARNAIRPSLVEHHEFDGCEDCERRRDTAFMDSLPDPVAKAIQETCDQFDKGAINWLFKHRPMKLLSLITLPYILPIDITIVILTKLWRQLPWMKKEVKRGIVNAVNLTKSLIMKMESNRALYSAQFSCQLSVTEFAYNPEVPSADGKDEETEVTVLSGPPTPQQAATIYRKISMSPSCHSLSSLNNPSHSPPQSPNQPRPDVVPSSPKPRTRSQRKSLRLERSHTFAGGRRKMGVIDPCHLDQLARQSDSNSEPSTCQLPPAKISTLSDSGLHRKSYAGSEQVLSKGSSDRKTSLLATNAFAPPERILSKVNFGFTMDLASSKSPRSSSRSLHSSSKNLESSDDDFESHQRSPDSSVPDVLETFKHLSEESVDGMPSCSNSGNNEMSALSLANRALNWQQANQRRMSQAPHRPGTLPVGGKRRQSEAAPRPSSSHDATDGFDRILAATSSKETHPLMAYYYMDENNQVKMTEIFNIPDDDATVMSTEELQKRW